MPQTQTQVPTADEAAPAPRRPELTLVPALAEPRLHGRARAEQRKLEAETRAKAVVVLVAPVKANGTATPTAPAKAVGSIVERDGVRYIVCPGQRGKCRLLVPVNEARVGSLGAAKRILGLNRYDELTEDNLGTISFCTTCADKILAGGHQSVAEAIAVRDERIAEYVADRKKAADVAAEYRDKEAAKRKSQLDGKFRPSPAARDRARLAASGGANGNPSNPRPDTVKAHKAVLAAKAAKAMHKGPSGGGGGSKQGKGGKKGKKK